MTFRTALAAALLVSTSAVAQNAVADLDTALRCAAAFGILAGAQERGNPEAMNFPPLGERGREFFVQVGARLIDERGLSEEQVETAFMSQANALVEQARAAPDPAAEMRSIAQPCLVLLNATIPPAALPPPR